MTAGPPPHPTIKVLHIASGDLWAGAEVQLYTLAKALKKRPDTEVAVILLNHGTLAERLTACGIETRIIDETRYNGIQILRRLIRLLRDLGPDVVHTHRIKENILGSLAAAIAGIPSLRTVHGAPEHPPSWWRLDKSALYWMDILCGRLLQRRIVAVSAPLAAALSPPYPATAISTIENGLDLEEVSKALPVGTSQSPDPGAKTKVGLVGRLVPVKRVDLFLHTARQIKSAHPELDISFHVYGDGPLRAALEALSRELELTDSVRFEGHCEAIHSKIAELDILMMTSDHEGLPMTLLEAMALRTLVVAHAVGGIPALLDQGRCGVLVTEHSAEGYTKALGRVLQSAGPRHALATRARARVARLYSAAGNAQAYAEVYASLTDTTGLERAPLR